MDLPNSRYLTRHRVSPWELLPLVAAIAFFYFFPGYLTLGTAILVMAMFAVSLDLVIGYAGIVTLGHALFFGLGAYGAARMSMAGFDAPIGTALAAGALAALAAAATGPFVLRLKHLQMLRPAAPSTASHLEPCASAGSPPRDVQTARRAAPPARPPPLHPTYK